LITMASKGRPCESVKLPPYTSAPIPNVSLPRSVVYDDADVECIVESLVS
jgi:hypothetical protein